MGWIGMAVLCALAFGVAALVFLRIVTSLGWDELRTALLQYAYKSFTFDGHVIPGMRPPLLARLVIRVLSPDDDERKKLLTDVALAAEQSDPPRREDEPRPLESSADPLIAAEYRARRAVL